MWFGLVIKPIYYSIVLQAPIPITEWKHTVVADKDGPICPQLIISGSADAGAEQSEDCLFMNVLHTSSSKYNSEYCVSIHI